MEDQIINKETLIFSWLERERERLAYHFFFLIPAIEIKIDLSSFLIRNLILVKYPIIHVKTRSFITY
jgi:hypothetical protein